MSTAKSTALTVSASLPACPLVVLSGDTIANVERLADAAKMVAITDAAQYNVAAQFLREASGLSKDIEKAREEVKAPFLDMGRKIDAAAKAEIAKLTAGIGTLKAKCTVWQAEQDRLAQIEADKQRKEQERLAREAAAAEKVLADAREAARVAALAVPDDDEDDLGSLGADLAVEAAQAEQQKVAAQAVVVAQAPRVIVQAAPVGIHYRTTLRHVVSDVRKLPAALTIVSPNDAEIRRLYCQGWKEGDPVPNVPGVVFTQDKQPIVRR